MAFGIDDAIAAGLKIVDKFIPDPAEKEKARTALRDALLQWDQGQLEVNKIEAASAGIFKGGWRPATGWVCAGAFAYHFVIQPFAIFVLAIFKVSVALPVLDIGTLMTVLLGMLGMGGLRTYEKQQGLTK